MANLSLGKQYTGDEKFAIAHNLLDKLFPFFPDYDDFDFDSGLYKKASFSKEEIRDYYEVRDQMEILMLKQYRFAEKYNNNNYNFHLNDLGREVKKHGSISKYHASLQKKQSEQEFASKLSLEELVLRVNKLRDEFKGLANAKTRANIAIWIAALSALGTIAAALIMLLQWKPQ